MVLNLQSSHCEVAPLGRVCTFEPVSATLPLYPTPLKPASLAWDKLHDPSRGATHPLCSGLMAAPKSLRPGPAHCLIKRPYADCSELSRTEPKLVVFYYGKIDLELSLIKYWLWGCGVCDNPYYPIQSISFKHSSILRWLFPLQEEHLSLPNEVITVWIT